MTHVGTDGPTSTFDIRQKRNYVRWRPTRTVPREIKIKEKLFLALNCTHTISPTMQRFVAKTIVNPAKGLGNYVTSGSSAVKSRLIAATPNHAEQLMDFVDSSSNVQTVGVAVDSVPFGAQRDGFSILEFDQRMDLSEQHELSKPTAENGNLIGGLRVARQNWQPSSSFLAFDLGSRKIVLPGANTTFSTGTESAIAFNDPSQPLSRTLLSSLCAKLPLGSTSGSLIGGAAPLIKISDELTVTSFQDNLIKTLNDSPAAGFLERASKLQQGEEYIKRVRKVFATITSVDGTTKRFEVTAGGGGSWSPKASMLVLEPEAKFHHGDRIYFSMYEPTDENRQSIADQIQQLSTQQNSFVLEATPVLESANERPIVSYLDDATLPCFGVGSESGFVMDDTKHAVDGEIVSINL